MEFCEIKLDETLMAGAWKNEKCHLKEPTIKQDKKTKKVVDQFIEKYEK